MNGAGAVLEGRFYRDADRAMLGGVCAGLAGHLGLNLKVTRILAFIAFLMAMPFAVIAYLAAVLLIPSVSIGEHDGSEPRTDRSCWKRKSRRRFRKSRRRAPDDLSESEAPRSDIAVEVEKRCHSMDQRLADLERQVTSKRFQIDQELGRL